MLAIDALEAVEGAWVQALGLEEGALQYMEEELGTPVWDLPDRPVPAAEVSTLSRGVDAPAGSFTVSPSLEPAARALGVHPRQIAELHRRTQLSPALQHRLGARLASWLVGIAFGRWDADALHGHEPTSVDEPLPIIAPAGLVDRSPDGDADRRTGPRG